MWPNSSPACSLYFIGCRSSKRAAEAPKGLQKLQKGCRSSRNFKKSKFDVFEAFPYSTASVYIPYSRSQTGWEEFIIFTFLAICNPAAHRVTRSCLQGVTQCDMCLGDICLDREAFKSRTLLTPAPQLLLEYKDAWKEGM